MQRNKFITPYIAPVLDDQICQVMQEHGKRIKLQKKEYILCRDIINSFVFVKSGMLGRIRDTPIMSKQTHMEIIPPGRVANFLNFFSPGRVRISLLSLRVSEVYITPFDAIYKLMAEDEGVRIKVSEMYGANAESSLRSCHCNFIFPCKYRLLLFFKALARHAHVEPDPDGWVPLPYKLTREEYCQIIFCGMLNLDNILQEWKKNSLYKKNKDGSFVRIDLLKRGITDSLADQEKRMRLLAD